MPVVTLCGNFDVCKSVMLVSLWLVSLCVAGPTGLSELNYSYIAENTCGFARPLTDHLIPLMKNNILGAIPADT